MDSHLSLPEDLQVAKDVVFMIFLALKCIHPNPQSCSTMQQVFDKLLGNVPIPRSPYYAISLRELKDQEISFLKVNILYKVMSFCFYTIICFCYFIVVKSSLYLKTIMKRDDRKRHIIFIVHGNFQ